MTRILVLLLFLSSPALAQTANVQGGPASN